MRRYALTALALLSAACGDSIAQEGANMKTYDWLPSESAPKEAPIYFVRGDLVLAGGGTTYVPDTRIVSNGWGQIGSTHVVGEDKKPLPTNVSLTWLSLLENRFYAGQFALPLDRLTVLFDRGTPLPAPRQRAAYGRVVFGMAPGGNVSVWATAGEVVTEVATFKASPTEVPFSQVTDNPEVTRESFIRENLEFAIKDDAARSAAAQPERLAAWGDYPRRLAWTAQLAGGSPQGAVLWFSGVNGERDWFDLADPQRGGEPLPPNLPVPASLRLNWRSAQGMLSADIALDPVESVAAFKKLAAADRPGAMTLMVEPSPTGDTVDVFLRRGELAYRFKNTKVQVFGAD
ncbi:DUF2931 family protein [Sphingomonas sp.]|jgi:hypothetical protein|uniref:DUF2931 family protein n=1 Tax=Sphingomonas sp. TaxID=28214 RepID=UPI002D7F5755|nr:DUF2931 family protein [Sphingomonas sp.]HEU0044502.1 DUF2931 family protein [Sphingomonas sp.]